MKALFWKETRENLKWALLAAVGVTAAMFYALKSNPNEFQYGDEAWQTLCSKPFLLISSFGFPAVALALGFLQILTELRRDQWAFLVHRPVTRNAIFWGKALPGTLLYLFAVLVPLFGVAWWVSLPGSVAAPFDWRLVNPPLWDAIAALAFYFAALQAGVMSGPWFGRRLIPLIAVCFGAIAIQSPWQQFHVAATGALTILLLSVLSAWAAILSNGSFRNATAWGKAAMTFLGIFGLLVLSGWWDAGWKLAFPPAPYVFKDLSITKNGDPVVITQTENLGITKAVTLDNVELSPGETGIFPFKDFLDYAAYLPLKYEPSENWRSASLYFFPICRNNSTSVSWYLVTGHSLFSSYGKSSNRFEHWLGPLGLAADFSHPPEGFRLSVHGRWAVLHETKNDVFLKCKDAILGLNLNSCEIFKRLPMPQGERIIAMNPISSESNDGPFDYIVATEQKIEIRSSTGTSLFSTRQISNLSDYSRILFFWMPDRSRCFFLYIPPQDLTSPMLLLEASGSGEIVRRYKIPSELLRRPRSLNVAWNAATTPLGVNLWDECLGYLYNTIGIQRRTPDWAREVALQTRRPEHLSLSLLFGIVSAGVGHILLIRLGMSARSRWAWTVFLLFYGFAGLITLAVVHEWPCRKRCVSCGHKRSIEQTGCGHCGASWPARDPDGTEIIEPASPLGWDPDFSPTSSQPPVFPI